MQTIPQTLLIAAVVLHQLGGCCLHHGHAEAVCVTSAAEHAGTCCGHKHQAPQPSSHPAGECDEGACHFNRCTTYLDVDGLFDLGFACPLNEAATADGGDLLPSPDAVCTNIGCRCQQPLYLMHQVLLI